MMKLCINCSFYQTTCNSPNNGISLVDGEPKPYMAYLSRSDESRCGTDGKWFNPKGKPVGPPNVPMNPILRPKWWKFWR